MCVNSKSYPHIQWIDPINRSYIDPIKIPDRASPYIARVVEELGVF